MLDSAGGSEDGNAVLKVCALHREREVVRQQQPVCSSCGENERGELACDLTGTSLGLVGSPWEDTTSTEQAHCPGSPWVGTPASLCVCCSWSEHLHFSLCLKRRWRTTNKGLQNDTPAKEEHVSSPSQAQAPLSSACSQPQQARACPGGRA